MYVKQEEEEFIAIGSVIVLKKEYWKEEETLEEAINRNMWFIVARMCNALLAIHEHDFHNQEYK